MRSDANVVNEEFWARYSSLEPNTGCWLWMGWCSSTGYGAVTVAGRTWYAHRLAYEHFRGVIPAGLCIDHLCRVRCCANPDHLEVVPVAVNTLRGEGPTAKNARKRVCKRGHLLVGDNVEVSPRGHRKCITCRNAGERRRYHERRAAER